MPVSIQSGSSTYADRAKAPKKQQHSSHNPPQDGIPSPSSPSTESTTPKQPVVNVWTLRAARRAAPVPVIVPPSEPDRAPDVVRSSKPDRDPWPTVAIANSNGKPNGVIPSPKVSRPTTPPPQIPSQTPPTLPSSSQSTSPRKVDVPIPIKPSPALDFTPMPSAPSAWGVSPSSASPIPPNPASSSASISTSPYPSASVSASASVPPSPPPPSSAVSSSILRSTDSSAPTASSSTSASTSPLIAAKEGSSSGSSKPRTRKWVAIPPEELRAAAEQQQQPHHRYRANGYPRREDGWGHRDGNGFVRDAYRGAGDGRKSHSHSASHSARSGATSRAESAEREANHRFHELSSHPQQIHPDEDRMRGDEPQFASMPPPPQPQWAPYLPQQHQQQMYAPPPPPPGYYPQGPYGGVYEPAPYLYWGAPPPVPSNEDGVAKEGWWMTPLQLPPQPPPPPPQEDQGSQSYPLQQQQLPQERPLPPSESGAVSLASGVRGNGGGVVFGFGSVDLGLAGLEEDVDSSAEGGLVPSRTTGALASSSNPPPTLPMSVSAPAREPTLQEAVVWPANSTPAWEGPSPETSKAGGPLFAIGVSPRTCELHLPGTEVVDLTVSLPLPPAAPSEGASEKWEFGTTRVAVGRYEYGYGAGAAGGVPPYPYTHPVYPPNYGYDAPYGAYPPPPGPPVVGMGMYGMPPPPGQSMGMYGMPPPPAPTQMMPNVNGPAEGSGEGNTSPTGVDDRISNSNGNANANDGVAADGGSEWEVKDYGYRHSVPSLPYPDIPYVPRAPRSPEYVRDGEYPSGRPRRGSYSGAGYYEPRGGFGGRRGRGFRGTWRGGFNARGGGGFQPGRGGAAPSQQQPPPPSQQQPPAFSLTPPPQFTPLVPEGYYAPPAPYLPGGYEYQPHNMAPVPMVRTRLSFPIDRLRQEILGQLEFYLSPDNMATDLYLRQQMDSQGWIRIEVLASFKRVQAKTMDVNLVKDLLDLSEYAEVRGEWVRSTEGWEKFVLPTAMPSVVDAEVGQSLLMQADKPEEGEYEEEDEEDVVFVMGREGQQQPWIPEPPR